MEMSLFSSSTILDTRSSNQPLGSPAFHMTQSTEDSTASSRGTSQMLLTVWTQVPLTFCYVRNLTVQQPPTWNLTINDTSPVFFYCGAPDSCLGHHMIGVINANATFNLSQQLSFFNDQTIMLQPGEPLPAEGATVTSSSTSTTSIQTPSSSAQATPSSSASHVSLSTGSIAGIAVGVAIVFALVGALFWFMGRSRILKQSLEQARVTPNAPPPSNRLFNGNEHDSDTRWSVSYGGSTVPEKRTSQMNTVHTIDRYGSPELDGNHVSELGGVATEHPWQSRSSER